MWPVNVDVPVKAYGNDAVLNGKYIRFYWGCYVTTNTSHGRLPTANAIFYFHVTSNKPSELKDKTI